jgi:hypothetical protein
VTVLAVDETTASVRVDYGEPFADAGQVVLVGDVVEGSPVRGVVSGWSPAPHAVAYEWLKNGEPIMGATGAAYIPAASDVGAELSVRVTVMTNGYRHEEVTSGPVVVGQAPARLEVSRNRVTVGADGGTHIVGVDASAEWELSGDYPSWVMPASVRGGAGSRDIVLVIAENPTTTPRSATVIVRLVGNAVTRTVEVEQVGALREGTTCGVEVAPGSGVPGWSAALGTWDAPSAGGLLPLSVTTNQGSWTATADADSPWVTTSRRGDIVDVSTLPHAATAGDTRYGTVMVQCGSAGSVAVQVIQNPEPRLALGVSSLDVPWRGQVGHVAVVSNGAWTVGAVPEWIHLAPDAGSRSDGWLSLAVEPNQSAEARSATLDVANQGNTQRLVVRQAGRPQPTCDVTPLTLPGGTSLGDSPRTLIVENRSGGSGVAAFVVSSDDGHWTAESDVDWLNVSPNSSVPNLGAGVTTVGYFDPPVGSHSRTGTLTFRCGEASVEFTIIQALPVIVEPSSLSVDAAAQTKTVTVNTRSTSWTVSPWVGWVSADPASGGPGSTEVTLAFAANTSASARTGNVSIGGTLIQVEQAGAPTALTIAPTMWEASPTGSSATATVSLNHGYWSVASKPSWVTAGPAQGYAGTTTLTMSATANTGPAREGSIVLVSNGQTASITVTQAEVPINLSVTPNSWSPPAAASSTTATVTLDRGYWSVDSKPDWVTVSPTGGGDSEITLSVPANTGAAREGEVVLAADGQTASITVTQAGAPTVITVAPSSVQFSAQASMYPLTVSVNYGSWSLQSKPEWVYSVSPQTGVGRAAVHVIVMDNTGLAREGLVVFVSNGQTASFTVRQGAAPDADDCEAQTTTSCAFTFDGDAGTGAGTLGMGSDHDYWRLVPPASGTWTISSAGVGDVYGRLRSASGVLLAEDDNSGGAGQFSVTYDVVAGTPYYVEISNSDSSDSNRDTGEYTLVAFPIGSGSQWPAFDREFIQQYMPEDEVRTIEPDGSVRPIVHYVDVGIRTIKPANWDSMTPDEQIAYATWISKDKVQEYLDQAAAYWSLKVGTEVQFPIKQFRLFPVTSCTSSSAAEYAALRDAETDGGYDRGPNGRRSTPGNVALTIGGPNACIGGASAAPGSDSGLFNTGSIRHDTFDGGGPSDDGWLPTSLSHEMGHVFGLGHASAPYDPDPTRNKCPAEYADGPFRSNMNDPEAREGGEFCLVWEYQDYLDIMGGQNAPTLNTNQLSAVQLAKLGALDAPNAVRTVTTPGSGVFTLINQTVAGRSGLRVILAPGSTDSFKHYAIEMGSSRRDEPAGVRIQRWMVGYSNTILVNAKDGVDNVMGPGDSFVSRDGRLRVTVLSVSELTATVRVDYGEPYVEVGQVTLSGQVAEGSTVRAVASGWSPVPETATYQWLRDGEPITGATDSAYTPVGSDVGTELSVRMTVTVAGYRLEQVTSDPVVVVAGTVNPTAISVSPTSWSPGAGASSQTATVSLNSATWQVASKPTWATVSPTTGAGNSQVTVSVTANTGASRQGSIVFTSNGQTAVMSLGQAGVATAISVTPATWAPSSSASSTTATVSLNYGTWVLQSAPSWVTVSQEVGGDNTETSLSVPLNWGAPRHGDVVFASNGKTASIAVSQEGAPTQISAIPSTWQAAAAESSRTATVYVNHSTWSVQSKPEWVTVTPEIGEATSSQVSLTASANTGPARQGSVVFVSNGETASIAVTQAAGPLTFSVTPSMWQPHAGVATTTVALSMTYGPWSVSSAPEWVTVSPTEGAGDAQVTLSTTANDTDAARRGYVTFDHPNGRRVSVTITQAMPTVLTVTPTAWQAPASASSTSVQVSLNSGTWSVASKPDWVTLSTSTAPGTYSITVYTAANTGSAREGSVVFTSNGQTASLLVSQAAGETAIEVTPRSWQSSAVASATTATVSLNHGSWSVESKPDWVTVSPTSGSGGDQVTVSTTANAGAARQGEVVFVSNGRSVSMTVSQAEVDTEISVYSTYWWVWAGGSSGLTSTVMLNRGTWELQSAPSWVTVTPTTGGAGSTVVSLSVPENPGPSERQGYVVFVSNGQTATIDVNQGWTPREISVTPSTWAPEAGGSTTTATVSLNYGSWTVQSKPSWVSVSPDSGGPDQRITLTAGANTGSAREGAIVFVSNDQTASVTVSQRAGYPDDCGGDLSTECVFEFDGDTGTAAGSLEIGSDHDYWRFIPPLSGQWTIRSNGTGDVYGHLRSATGAELTRDDDGAGNGQFELERFLIAGETYYVEIRNWSSSDSNTDTGPYTLTADLPRIDLSQDLWVTGQAAASIDVMVTSTTGEFRAGSSASWLTVTPTRGSTALNGEQIRVSVTRSTVTTRTGTITFIDQWGTLRATLTVTQAVPTLAVDVYSPPTWITAASAWNPAPAAGGSLSLRVTTNQPTWSVTSDRDWSVVSTSSGVSGGTFTWTAARNTGAARSGSITIRAGSITRTIGITQTAAPAPTLTVDVYSSTTWIAAASAWNPAPAAGGSLSLRVTTNQPTWSVTSDRDWSVVSTDSGVSGGTFTWTAQANTGAARSGSITIRAGSATRTIGITQTAAPAPTLTVDVYSPPTWIAAASAWNPAPAAGGTLSLRVTTNHPNWSVTSDRDWSVVSTDSGVSGGTFTWTAARNTGAARSGSITIRAGSATRTIGITQTAAPAPTLTVEVYSPPKWIAAASAWNPAPAAGGTLSLRVTTNQPNWSVTSDRDWSVVSTDSGVSGGTFTWTAARNTGAARSGSITIRAGSATRTIGITQTRG